jgi:hypothetical protein
MLSTNPVRESGAARTRSTRARQGLLRPAVVLAAWLAPARTAQAADASEFWPELNAFVPLTSQTRLFLDAPYADGKESDHATLDVAAYLDVSLKPIIKRLRTEDWQRSR